MVERVRRRRRNSTDQDNDNKNACRESPADGTVVTALSRAVLGQAERINAMVQEHVETVNEELKRELGGELSSLEVENMRTPSASRPTSRKRVSESPPIIVPAPQLGAESSTTSLWTRLVPVLVVALIVVVAILWVVLH